MQYDEFNQSDHSDGELNIATKKPNAARQRTIQHACRRPMQLITHHADAVTSMHYAPNHNVASRRTSHDDICDNDGDGDTSREATTTMAMANENGSTYRYKGTEEKEMYDCCWTITRRRGGYSCSDCCSRE